MLAISTTVLTILTAANPIALAVPLVWGWVVNRPVQSPKKPTVAPDGVKTEKSAQSAPIQNNSRAASAASPFRLYRQTEVQRAIASLKANSPILITGEEGSGKSVLKEAVRETLSDEGFTVASIELATTKQMLLDMCEQLGIDTYNLEGKSLTADGLKNAIATHFQNEVAFLLVDDAHSLPMQFRQWLKSLKRQGVPMLLLATDPPRSDVFLNLPRIELKPLPEYAIRELMEQAALDRGLQLANHQLARLQERTGGNPMLAQRVVDEEYLGLDNETGDHRRYFDITPLILLAGTGFIMLRFFALGTNNPSLYIMTGAIGALFLGVSRILYSLPKDSRRIE